MDSGMREGKKEKRKKRKEKREKKKKQKAHPHSVITHHGGGYRSTTIKSCSAMVAKKWKQKRQRISTQDGSLQTTPRTISI